MAFALISCMVAFFIVFVIVNLFFFLQINTLITIYSYVVFSIISLGSFVLVARTMGRSYWVLWITFNHFFVNPFIISS